VAPLLLPLLCALGLGPARAAEPQVKLRVDPQLIVDLAHDRPGEDTIDAVTRFGLWLRVPQGSGTFFAGARGQHLVLWGPSGSELDGGGLEAAFELRLDETGWQGPAGPLWIAAGNLYLPRGALVALSPLDVLNGQDLRAGLATPPEVRRLPSPAVQLELGQRWIWSATLLPVGAADRVPLWGTDSSLIRQGMLEGAVQDLAARPSDPVVDDLYEDLFDVLGQSLQELDAQTRRGLEGALLSAGLPSPVLDAAEVAGGLKGSLGPVDIELMAATLRARRPLIVASPKVQEQLTAPTLPGVADLGDLAELLEDPIQLKRPRTGVFGAAASGTAGAFGLKAEGAFTTQRPIQTAGVGGALSPVVSAAAGVDRTLGTVVTVGLEARFEHLTAPPPYPLMFSQDDVLMAAFLDARLLRQRLSLSGAGLYDLNFSELALTPQASFAIDDRWRVQLGALLVAGPRRAPQTFEEALAYGGGPIGALGDTEHVSVGLSWAR
jgi:hypothetical protein